MKQDREIRQVKEVRGKRGGAVKKAPPGYYTAQQAQQKLGMNASTFGYYVRKGKIKRFVPPLRTEGFYEKKEIDHLATELAIFLHTTIDEIASTEVRVAHPEDTPGIVKILTDRGWQTAPATLCIKWYEVNGRIDYVALWKGEVMGYIRALPLEPNTLEDMMSGKKRSWHIQPDHILPYEPGKTYDLYVGIATNQNAPNHTHRFGFRLITGFLSFLEGLAEQKIYIRRLYAVSAEPDGQKLSKGLGFVEQPAQEGDLFPRFMLDLETSDSRFVQLYQQAKKHIIIQKKTKV